MKFMSLIGIAVLAVILIYILSGIDSKLALAASAAVSILVFLNLIPGITEICEKIKTLLSFNATGQYGGIMMKALGISIIASIGTDIAKNLGSESLAARVEDISVIEMMIIAVPLASELLENAVSLIG